MARCMISLIFLLCAIHMSLGSHFHGGSMSWKKVGNQIQLTNNLGFTYNEGHGTTGYQKCTESSKENGTPLGAGGTETKDTLTCDGCIADEEKKKMQWICEDYDQLEDSAVGKNEVYYTIPTGQQTFDISWENCCWIELLISPKNPDAGNSGHSGGWKLTTHVDIKTRTNGNGNYINSSPWSASIPLEKFYKGCQYHLKIPVADEDNDDIRCRYADPNQNECAPGARMKACGVPTDGLTINEKSCTLEFNTTDIGEGYHAVNVMIEDFQKPYNANSKPLSKVPFLFLLKVEGESKDCLKPTLVDQPRCRTVRPGDSFRMVIRADPSDIEKPIRIRSQKPNGMDATETVADTTSFPSVPGRKMSVLTWKPTEDDIGQHSVCYSALDSESYTSGLSCTRVYVEENALQPDMDASSPSSGEEIDMGETWVVQFNKKIERPQEKSDARIKIVNSETRFTAFELNPNDDKVNFTDQRIEFVPPREALSSNTQYELILDEGVAMGVAGAGCGSQEARWTVNVICIPRWEDDDCTDIKEHIVTPAPPPEAPEFFNCYKSTLESIQHRYVGPEEDGCFKRNMGEYKLKCCPKECGMNGPPAGPPAPHQPPGTNGLSFY